MRSFFIKFIRTEGALRRPLTYDDHPIPLFAQKDRETGRQKDKRSKRRWIGLRRHSDDLQWTPKIEKGGRKRGVGGQCHQDLLIYCSMIYDLKRSVDLRWLFDHWCYIHPKKILFLLSTSFFPYDCVLLCTKWEKMVKKCQYWNRKIWSRKQDIGISNRMFGI